METSSNSIQDWMTNEEEEKTEEAKAERVKIEIETTLKAIRDSVTKVKKAEDNNMCLVDSLHKLDEVTEAMQELCKGLGFETSPHHRSSCKLK